MGPRRRRAAADRGAERGRLWTDVLRYLSESPAVSVFTREADADLPDLYDRGARSRVPDGLLPGPGPGAEGRDEDEAFQTWIRRHDEYV